MGISNLESSNKETIRRRYDIHERVTPGRIVQLLNNGKINDLPLKAFPNVEHSTSDYYLNSSSDYQIILWAENIYSLHYQYQSNGYPRTDVFRLNEDLTVEKILYEYLENYSIYQTIKSMKLNDTTYISAFCKNADPYDIWVRVKTFNLTFTGYENTINITLKQGNGAYETKRIFKISESRLAAFFYSASLGKMVCFIFDVNLIDSTFNLVSEITIEPAITPWSDIIQISSNKYLLLYNPSDNVQEKRYRIFNIDESGQLESYGNETVFEICQTSNKGRMYDFDYQDLGQGEFLICYDSDAAPYGVKTAKYVDDHTIYFDDFIHFGHIDYCRLSKIDEITMVLSYKSSYDNLLLVLKKVNGSWIKMSPAISFRKDYVYFTRVCKVGDKIIMPMGYNYSSTHTLYTVIIKELLYGTWLGIAEDEKQVLIKGITDKVLGITPGIDYWFDTDGKLYPQNTITSISYLFNQDQTYGRKSPMKALNEKELYLHSPLF